MAKQSIDHIDEAVNLLLAARRECIGSNYGIGLVLLGEVQEALDRAILSARSELDAKIKLTWGQVIVTEDDGYPD